jgi:hypothetical protein
MERGPHYWGTASAASSFFWLLKICRARFWLSANGTLTNLLDGLPIGSIFHAATDISEQNYGPDSSIIWPIRDCARHLFRIALASMVERSGGWRHSVSVRDSC